MYTDNLGRTILHPQYIMKSLNHEVVCIAQKQVKGALIDIGCGRMPYKKDLLPFVTKYVGVDHPSVSKLYKYGEKPDILADAIKIPVKNQSFESAILFEVLEHLQKPDEVFNEIFRILKPQGILVISVPFMYPLHDVPYDNARYSPEKIKDFLISHGFKVKLIKKLGGFWESWFLLLIVYLLKRMQHILKNKKSLNAMLELVVDALFVVPFFFVANIFVFLIRKIHLKNQFYNYFPLDIVVVAQKNKQ